MFSSQALHRPPSRYGPAAPETTARARRLGFGEVEEVVRRLAASYLDGGRLELLSTARSNDGATIALEVGASALGPRADVARARAAIAERFDPVTLEAQPDAEVRVLMVEAA